MRTRLPRPRVIGLLGVLALGAAIAASMPATAREHRTMRDGVLACKRYCDQRNHTVASQHTCYVKCEKYWLCNGSDATEESCADGAALPIDRHADDGAQPPPRPTGRRSEAAPRATTTAPK